MVCLVDKMSIPKRLRIASFRPTHLSLENNAFWASVDNQCVAFSSCLKWLENMLEKPKYHA